MFKPLELRFEEELDEGSVSDICFGLGPAEETRLFSSRSILAMASPVFHTMFFTPHWHSSSRAGRDEPPEDKDLTRGSDERESFIKEESEGHEEQSRPGFFRSLSLSSSREGSTASPTNREGYRPGQHIYVAVTDIEPTAFRCLLRYVHHLEPKLTLDNVLHVYRAADKYQIEGLLGGCAVFIEERADPWDVHQVLQLFDIACRLGLERYSISFAEKLGRLSRLQTSRLLSAEEFLTLHPVSLETLLRSDGLAVGEELLWLAVRSWAERKAARETPEGALFAESWQDFLRPLRHFIHFPAMRLSFFAKEVAQSRVLSADEVVELFCHLATPPSQEAQETLAFRSESRVPQLAWCGAAGGQPVSTDLPEDLGLAFFGEAETAVIDGRGFTTTSWGSSIILGSSGSGFHLAFGSVGFSSGLHSWTIFWRPLDPCQSGVRARVGRGGAAGIAVCGHGASTSSAPVSAAVSGGVATCQAGAKVPTILYGTSRSSGVGTAPPGDGNRQTAGSAEEPSAKFLDWPSCIVFGVKKDVCERRYVAWDLPESEEEEKPIRFAITLDFENRLVLYSAANGERCWQAPLTHEGPVFPVIASCGPHHFRIAYGMHV